MAPQFLTSRRLGALVAAGALVAGATTAAVWLADPAGATPLGTCTLTDTTTSEVASEAAPALHNVSTGDALAVSCTGLNPNVTIAVAGGDTVAYLPDVQNGVGQATFADAGGAHVDTSSATGTLSDTYTVHNFTIGADSNASCTPNPSQSYMDAGLACFIAIADVSDGNIPILVTQLQFGTTGPSVTPTLTTNKSNYGVGQTITIGGAHWWGTPWFGSGNATAAAAGIPAPTLLIDGNPVSSNLATSGANWSIGGGLVPHGDLSGSYTIPSGLSSGSHSLTVLQADATPYIQSGNPTPGTVAETVNFNVNAPTASAVPGTGNTGTEVTVTGDNWVPGTSATLSFTDGPSTGTATVNSAGHLSGSITVSADEVVGPNNILVSQTSGATTLSASAPFAVSNIPALNQEIDQQVNAGTLSDSQSAATVTMGDITLDGSVQTTAGNLSTVTVIDGRGSFGGWSLTGQLEGDFTTNASSHNSFPGSNLSWTPAVSTAIDGQNGTGDTTEVQVGATQALSTSSASSLAAAAAGGGGGSFECDAALSLKVPATIHSGLYKAVLDINLG